MHNESVIALSDLRYLCIKCQHCATVVTLDMKESYSPQSCPGCGKQYDTAIPPSINSFREFFQKLAAIPDRIRFRAEAP